MTEQRKPLRPFKNLEFEAELIKNANLLVADGKGILAADESTNTIGNRLSSINVENNLENRTAYRKALFSTEGLNKHISGVILFDETLRDDSLTSLLKKQQILLGIKVDMGTRKLPFSDVLFTQGLTDLDVRCKEYYKLGCRFAKWRAVLQISNGIIEPNSIQETAYTLARYAATCQANGLVPIVEPEILMDGKHCIGSCAYWTEKVLAAVIKSLSDQFVCFEGMLLKNNMCLPGNDFEGKRNIKTNAEFTVRTLRRTLPAAVPGVTFLSGGQSEEEASLHLSQINKLGPHPWKLSFSFGRALQHSALKAWQGKAENVPKMQAVLLERASANQKAALGQYEGGAEGSKESLFQKGYVY